MPPQGIPTDDSARKGWLSATFEPLPVAPNLVLVWYPDDPTRVGHAAPVTGVSCLGRDHPPEPLSSPLVEFIEQRSGSVRATPPLTASALSRRQLELAPREGGRVHVRNIGRRVLSWNGSPVVECVASPGDTLMLEHTAVFYVEERPLAYPACPSYRAVPAFAFGAADPFGMVGESVAAWMLREALGRAAEADDHVLLLGESGAGKEVAATVVHGLSPRRNGPLIARNAATMPGTLIDAELFGNARNYPNVGSPERPGLIGQADLGHLFLDEIGQLQLGLQAHLLRVLDLLGEYHRLGEAIARVSDFRLIAATNSDPDELKHDFLARFHRRVLVPGLGERRSDIPLLIRALVARIHARTPERLRRFLDDDDPLHLHLDPRFLCALVRHNFRFHVRELLRLLELSLATSPGVALEATPEVVAEMTSSRTPTERPSAPSHPISASPSRATETPPPLAEPAVRRLSVAEVTRALADNEGNVSRTAVQLRVHRNVLIRFMNSRGITRLPDSDG